jgi:hypothetical protein
VAAIVWPRSSSLSWQEQDQYLKLHNRYPCTSAPLRHCCVSRSVADTEKLQKLIRKKLFFYNLKVTDENCRVRIWAGSGSISQRYGSADPDPDPYQNSWISNTGFPLILVSESSPLSKTRFKVGVWFVKILAK